MSFIENIRSKSHGEKVRIIWIAAGITAVLLIILWIFTTRINKNSPKDMTLFQTIGRGAKDFKDNYKK